MKLAVPAILSVVLVAVCAAGALGQAPVPGQARAVPDDGAALFQAKCGYCHLRGGTGTMMLARRLGADNALLAERRDLTRDYVVTVVRNGLASMPALTRVEVTDAQIDLIGQWLEHHGSATP